MYLHLITFDPEARQKLLKKSFSETPLRQEGQDEKAGCRCIGFKKFRIHVIFGRKKDKCRVD
jgi:hypothetical protein